MTLQGGATADEVWCIAACRGQSPYDVMHGDAGRLAFDVTVLRAARKWRTEQMREARRGGDGLDALLNDIRIALTGKWMG